MNSRGGSAVMIRHPSAWLWSNLTAPTLLALVATAGIIAHFGAASLVAAAFEAYVLAAFVVGAKIGKRFFASLLAFFYLALQLALAIQGGDVYWEDFIRATKPWIYLALFLSCYRAATEPTRVWCWVIYAFAGFYLMALASGDSRPRLIVENNFEIPFVLSIYSALVVGGKVRLASLPSLATAFIVLISMSRSGVVAYMAVMALLVVRRVRQSNVRGFVSLKRVVGYSWLVPVALLCIWITFASRDDVNIDRVDFFRTFWATFSEFDWWTRIFGAGALTELPAFACRAHAYFLQELAGHHGQCYAVVWHASAMRLIHDFGVFGFGVLYFSFYWVLRSRYSRYDALIGLIPPLVVGFSVGGVYNYFSMFGVLVYFALASRQSPASQAPLRVAQEI